MRVVTNKELSTFKILPFDLYCDINTKILQAGEVLTPGKLIMLKNYPEVFTEDFANNSSNENDKSIDNNEHIKKLMDFSFENIDVSDFETTLNRDNTLKMEDQTKIKYYYKRTLELFLNGYFEEGLIKLSTLANVIISDIFKELKKTKKGSQVRFLGEYELCHPLNVAIVSGLIAKKLEYTNLELEQVILAALLHDIGKLKINNNEVSPLLTTNEEIVANHTKLGYKIIKELGLPDAVAKVALEHHENNDGSGYPVGLSSDYISELSQIVNVANYYDNLAFNRTSTHVSNNRDVLRAMLEVGTKRFSAKILYTFVHMFNYDDPKDFIDMAL